MSKSTIFAFIAGAAIGSAGTWYFLKKKYERIAQEEIDSVKERFSVPINPFQDNDDHTEEPQQTENPLLEKKDETFPRNDYSSVLKKCGYEDREDDDSPFLYDHVTGAKEENVSENPCVISPEEYGLYDDYAKVSLSYYFDGILADEDDEIVEDIEGTVGVESLKSFGEYDEDSVYVRNDRLKVYYEILRDLRTYKNILKDKPYIRRN